MGFLFKRNNSIKYGIIVDIGSGSVLASIIASDSEKLHPDILWSRREYTKQRQNDSLSISSKNIITSLVNVLMTLDAEGRKAMTEIVGHQKLTVIQVTIAAPWSYTVAKTITYKNDEPFEISKELVDELIRTAQKKVHEEIFESEKVRELGLSIISKSTIQLFGNGYLFNVTNKQKVSELKLIQISAAAQKFLTTAVDDIRDKLFPETKLYLNSFMLPFFSIMKESVATTGEYCLVDITYEATEIGVVRNGFLNYCTHTPIGSFTIAREISKVLSITPEEAYGYLNEKNFLQLLNEHGDKQKAQVKEIVQNYKDVVSELFKETGDALSIPRKIYLHSNLKSEPFFNEQIAWAANAATKMNPDVCNVTKRILNKSYTDEEIQALNSSTGDTSLLISARFFHTQANGNKFK